MLETLIGVGSIVVLVIAVLVALIVMVRSCWKVAGPNEVLIISGLHREPRRKCGGGTFVIPLVQRVQRMTLENIQVDFTSRNEIPTKDAIHVLVDAVANMSISTDPKRQATAASKFAGYSIKQIQDIVIPVLEGNIREIISQTNFEDLIRGDKKAFSELVMENVTPNLADLGIDLTTFNIQNFSDKNGVIHDLGIENIEKIKKEAENSGLVLSQEQLNMAKSLIYPLVESAYRLKLQGKIEDAKERVLTIARTELSKVGIDLSDSMIDEIRRACLVELEMTITELKGIEEE